ncbi:hypothetical protein BK809_0007928 [Diplodia seriata]|uniref:Rhodopsin domain-containing protein n=1 Tax=Diplodia seriata TaxID=420778 RepID=A0A1S8BKQ8_9PEZI|nr:hypothetical protein BK809_0007928 [Diplodia seriata]
MIIVVLEVENGGGRSVTKRPPHCCRLTAHRHRQYIDPAVFSKGMYLNFLSQPFYLFTALFVKESVGFFLLRITGRAKYRGLIAWIMAVLAVYTVACFVTLVLQCKDLRVIWDPTVKTTCWRVEVLHGLTYTNSIINIITDFAFAVLIPIPLIYPLQMSVRKKLSLLLLLGVGLIATGAAVARAAALPAYGRSRGDFLWDSRALTTWSVVETQVGIVAGCLPCAKPLLARFWPLGGLLSKLYYVSGGGGSEESSCSRSGVVAGRGGKWAEEGSEGVELVGFAGGGKGGGKVAVVMGGGEAKAFPSSTVDGRVVGGDDDDDDGNSIRRIDREIGGRGMSISGPEALGGGIMRTTNVRIDYGIYGSMV